MLLATCTPWQKLFWGMFFRPPSEVKGTRLSTLPPLGSAVSGTHAGDHIRITTRGDKDTQNKTMVSFMAVWRQEASSSYLRAISWYVVSHVSQSLQKETPLTPRPGHPSYRVRQRKMDFWCQSDEKETAGFLSVLTAVECVCVFFSPSRVIWEFFR